MAQREITVPVRLDRKTFRCFSWFDMMRLRKRWVRPVLFMLLLVAFALVALFSHREGSGMIGAVLLIVGLGLPLVYFGTFISQVNAQAARQKLDTCPAVYTVRLRREGIHVTNDRKQENPVTMPWKDVKAAYRVKGCVYLYVSVVRAFLLPDDMKDVSQDEVWAFLVKHMGNKCLDRR